MQYPLNSDSSGPSAPAGSVTGDDFSSRQRPVLIQCAAHSARGDRCPRPAEVAVDNGGDPAPLCLLHVFALLTASIDEQNETIILAPLQGTL
jgi:hypothetical protein